MAETEPISEMPCMCFRSQLSMCFLPPLTLTLRVELLVLINLLCLYCRTSLTLLSISAA